MPDALNCRTMWPNCWQSLPQQNKRKTTCNSSLRHQGDHVAIPSDSFWLPPCFRLPSCIIHIHAANTCPYMPATRLGASCDSVQVCTKRLITAEKLINGLGRDLSRTTPLAMTTDQAVTSKRSRHKRYKW